MLPRWRGERSSRFQRNMQALSADQEFGDDPAPEVPTGPLNPYEGTADAISALEQLLDGVRKGTIGIETMVLDVERDNFDVNSYNRDLMGVVPTVLSTAARLMLTLTLVARPSAKPEDVDGYTPDDFPEIPEAPRSAAGAAPARQLILDDDND